jgi:DNA-binding NarL/FixJ family response regulator
LDRQFLTNEAEKAAMWVKGIRESLRNHSDLHIIAIVNDGRELLDVLREQHKKNSYCTELMEQADVILLDQNMRGMDGLESMKYIRMSYPDIKIIMLTQFNDPYLVDSAKNQGAIAFLTKECTEDELLKCIRDAMKDIGHFPSKLLKTECRSPEKETDWSKRLTRREKELISHIKDGLTTKQAAAAMNISVQTAETHRKNINHKFGTTSPAGFIKFILGHGL